MRPDNTVSTAQRGSAALPSAAVKRKATSAMSTRGESKARAAASARASASAGSMAKKVSPKAGAAMSTRGETKARAAAKARTAVSAGQKKSVQTGIMNKNRAIKGAMSYMGNPTVKPAKASALSRQNAMSKNRGTRGAMGR